MKNFKITFFLIVLFSFFNLPLFCDSSSTTAKPYNSEEFPQGLKDLRRFEIITLGSMPFVMLDVNLVYSGIRVANGTSSSYNPFNTSSYTEDEQIKLILTSLGISTCIGLTDFVVQKIKQSFANKKSKTPTENNSILVVPIEEDPDAIKIETNTNSNENYQNDDEVEFLE